MAGPKQYTEGDVDATISGIPAMWEDTGDTLRAVSAAKPLPVSGTVTTGGLTDTQLRASDVKVTLDSESVAVTGPLTDTQLRASDVKVTLDSESVAVTGPLTDTQLRASDVKVTLDSEVVSVKADWRIANTSSTDANDSDKSFTVPASTEWQILFVRVLLASTATAGDRQLEITIEHPAGTITATLARAGAVQPASKTYEYLFAPGVADLTSFRDTTYLTTPIPPGTILYAADVIRIYDNNAVDAAADDMSVYVQYAYRSV